MKNLPNSIFIHSSFMSLIFSMMNIYFACLFVSHKRLNGWTNRAKIFVGPNMTPGKVYIWLNFQKFASNKIRFLIILKIHKICYKICAFFVLFYNVFKEKMLTNEIENRRKAPALKATDEYIFFKTMQLSSQGTGGWSSRIFHIGGFDIL